MTDRPLLNFGFCSAGWFEGPNAHHAWLCRSCRPFSAGTATTIAAETTKPAERRPPVAAKTGVRPASLRTAGKAAGCLSARPSFPKRLQDKRYADTLAREFNFITSENVMKWGPIQPEPDKWNFGPADALVEFAQKHDMKVKGHCLIWHEALPKWVNAEMTPEQLREAVRKHIFALVGHYKGKVYAWDVVNEAVDDKEGLRKTLFLDKLGEGYIAEAFRLAHEADPDVMLIYNDYGGEGLGGKSDRIYELVKKLKADGVPIHGVGLQMHISRHGLSQARGHRRQRPASGRAGPEGEHQRDGRADQGRDRRPARAAPGAAAGLPRRDRRLRRRRRASWRVTFWGFTDAHRGSTLLRRGRSAALRREVQAQARVRGRHGCTVEQESSLR